MNRYSVFGIPCSYSEILIDDSKALPFTFSTLVYRTSMKSDSKCNKFNPSVNQIELIRYSKEGSPKTAVGTYLIPGR